MNWYVGSEG